MPCLHAVVGIINAYEHAKKSEKCIGKKKEDKNTQTSRSESEKKATRCFIEPLTERQKGRGRERKRGSGRR